ncbi:MAG: DUF748 domain-containing protein [Nitrospirae bacterium]|nr:DUF748 domain-containing protein [Nitrospirota bacterium]
MVPRQAINAMTSRLNQKKTVKGIAVFLVVFSIAGFLILPPIVKSVLLKQLSEKLHRQVSIQAVRINPFMLSVTVRGLEIKEPKSQTPFVSFDELYLNLQTMSMFRRGIIAKEIKLVNPYLQIVRNEDLSYNFSDLLQMADQKPADKGGPGSRQRSLRFSLNNIQVINARIDFLDGPKHTKHEVRGAVLTVPFVSNLPYYLESYVQPAFSAKVNGNSVSFRGNTKPFVDSHETNIDLDLKDLNLPYYLAYSPVPLDFTLVSGLLDVQTSLTYAQFKDKEPTLSLKGSTSLKIFKIDDKAGNPLIYLPRLDISISSSDLMARNIHFAKIVLESPEINVSRDRAGKLNLLALMAFTGEKAQGKVAAEDKGKAKAKAESGKETKAEEKKSLPVIDADEIILANGKVIVADASEGRIFRTSLHNIQAKIGHFSTVKDKKAEAEASLQTDSQEEFRLTGNFSVEPLSGEGTVEVKQVVLKKYAPYYGKFVLFSIEDGRFDFMTKYSFLMTGNEPDLKVSDLTANVTALRLRKHGEKEDFLNFPALSVKETSADLGKREIVVGDISAQKGMIVVKRSQDSILNLQTLFAPAATPAARADAEPLQPKQKVAVNPWTVTAKKISLDRHTIMAEDLVPSEPVSMLFDQIHFRGENISTEKNTKGKVSLSLQIEKKGSLKMSGAVGLDPVSAQLKVVSQNVPIMPAVPYFADRIKIIVFDGSISSEGTLSARYSRDTGPTASYKGTASLSNFASVDKVNAEDFLKCSSLYVDSMDVTYNPLVVKIGEVSLSDFYARTIINADGSINLQNIIEKGEGEKEAAATKVEDKAAAEKEQGQVKTEAKNQAKNGNGVSTATDAAGKIITIEKITLQGGTVNFSDRFIKPNFNTNMLEIGGRITGLSSEETKMAVVEMRGKLDNYAPLEITGKVNPLRDDLFIDLNISFKDMDLSQITPYSGRYLGYVIEKGKLSLNLHYLIEKKKLDSQNKILLDQFTLGSQVESPDATKLPVRLAIALLKNRRGEIDLDIPVSGQIDDPKFSIGRIIIKILLNLLVKAATSPFALLGSLIGGGEELSYLEFDPGLSHLNEAGLKKVDTLVKALHDRPSLKIEIAGHADMDKDREGMKRVLFNRKVKAQKLKDAVQQSKAAVPVDDVKIEPAEYAKYLKLAYKDEKFPKPRNVIGMAKDLPVSEMEKLMLTHIEVKDDDLRTLASQRALAVKDLLLRSKLVEQERIFLVVPKTLQPQKKEKVRESRVDFTLK